MIDYRKETEKLIEKAEKCFDKAPKYKIRNKSDLNQFDIDRNLGYVYQIIVNEDVKYVGKSRGIYFRQRIKSHFLNEYKGTNSKIDRIKKETEQVYLKFITINPESVRNLIEEELIKKLTDKNSWNYKK